MIKSTKKQTMLVLAAVTIGALALTAQPTAVRAQIAPSSGAVTDSLPAQALNPAYLLSPDDQLDISVAGHDELKTSVTVLSDGTFNFPDVGTVRAEGLTVTQLTQVLTKKLGYTINQPDVTVVVKGSLAQKSSVLGAVKLPGQYDVKPTTRVLDLIAAAGGLAQDPAYTQATLVAAGGNKTTTIDVPTLMATADVRQNPLVKPGDVLLIQAGIMQQVQVTGEVLKPGSYPTGRGGISVVQLLSSAGGALPDAALAHAQILHNGIVSTVNLVPASHNLASPAATVALMPGDVLQIPAIASKVAILGEVKSPGEYPVPEGGALTLASAVTLAGGPLQDANLKTASLVRRNAAGTPVQITMNLGNVLRGQAHDIPLEAGDLVFVPPTHPTQPFNAMSIIGLLPYVGRL